MLACRAPATRKIARTSGGAAMKSTMSDCADEHDVNGHTLCRLHRVAASLEGAEEDAREEDADGPRSTKQGDRDGVEPDARVDALREARRHRLPSTSARETDEAAGDEHRVHVDVLDVHARDARGVEDYRLPRGTGSLGLTG